MLPRVVAGLIAAAAIILPRPAVAQPAAAGAPSWLVEAGAGRAWFADSPPVPHVTYQVGARLRVTPRLAVGPEVTFMTGEAEHRDTFVTGNLTWDLVGPSAAAGASVVPYAVAGVGFVQTTDPVGTGLFTSTEPTFTVGGGLRWSPGGQWYVAPEVRVGWELHWRAGVVVGWSR